MGELLLLLLPSRLLQVVLVQLACLACLDWWDNTCRGICEAHARGVHGYPLQGLARSAANDERSSLQCYSYLGLVGFMPAWHAECKDCMLQSARPPCLRHPAHATSGCNLHSKP